ncbi:MAG: dihydropteroate synthase [Mariniblastus sp.]
MISKSWQLRTQTLEFQQLPLVMGIVNVTPDSFSDGGKFAHTGKAVQHALSLAASGAAILDIGGESTRPYSSAVEAKEEISRVVPVIKAVANQTNVPISIDTSKSVVAQAAIDAGAEIINDVTGLEGDPQMIAVAKQTGVGVCAMHMKGTPQTMQDDPQYENVVDEILEYLQLRKNHLLNAGLELEKICLDPGIGFGKTHEHNLELLAHCERYHELGCPVLVGHSRKGFIANILADKTTDRDSGTLAITLMLARKRIQVVRVHEVEETVKALRVFSAAGGLSS